MSSPSLRPLIDTCQKCSTSPANHEPRSPANGSFQNPGVCPQAVPSFPSPTPTVLFLALAPFSAQAKYRKPRSSVFLCSQTLRKRLLRRLGKPYSRNTVRANSFRSGQIFFLVPFKESRFPLFGISIQAGKRSSRSITERSCATGIDFFYKAQASNFQRRP